LRSALDENTKARANWNALRPAQRKQFLYWLFNAKREETRRARTKRIVALVARKASLREVSQAAKR
jgi:uncharacterized protein YdeI (YjbR/CyaY-like superfamily)